MNLLIKKIRKLINGLSASDCVSFNNLILPAPHLRFGGIEFKDNKYFYDSALSEAERLIKNFGLIKRKKILDVGCGMGRLPLGIIGKVCEIKKYVGIDVDKKSIKWCKHYISKYHTNYQFIYINTKNLRYNPDGKIINNEFSFPLKNEEFDIIYLYSVFSHMTIEDIKIYLKEFKKILVKSGRIFLTAFIEENVPDMTINPKDSDKNWSGPLHCVRYDKKYFESIINSYDFNIYHFEYGNETDGQSAYYLSLN